MAFCLARAEWATTTPLCSSCRTALRPATIWRSPSGLVVTPALRHRGPARMLVHRLKYQGLEEVASLLGGLMAERVPAGTLALVPVPRARVRRVRYGIDPAEELARAVNRQTGIPIQRLLRAAVWWPRHAARSREGRRPPRFEQRARAGPGFVLIDDVATSGATLEAAARAVGCDIRQGMVATAPGRMSTQPFADAGEVAWR